MKKKEDVSIKGKINLALTAFISGFILNLTGLITAIYSHSLIAITDTINGIVESLSMFLAFIALKGVILTNKESYNYGRGKLENLASIGIGGALFISFLLIIKDAIHRISHPQELHIAGALVYILISLGTILTNFYLWQKAKYINEEAPSSSISSQEHVFFEKIVVSSSVICSLLLSLILEKLGFHWGVYIDPLASIILAFLILSSAYKIIKHSIYELLDGTLEESLQIIIMRGLTLNFNEYKDLYQIRSHRAGDTLFIEIFLDFDEDLRMKEVYEKIDKISKDIEGMIKNSKVTIVPTNKPNK